MEIFVTDLPKCVKCGCLILRKITELVPTRHQILG